MGKTRSPNYPSLGLEEAIEAVTAIHKADLRNRVSREAVAEHMGYKSLSGPALAKLGALRAYGFLEGSGDDLRVSQDGVVIIADEPSSEDRQRAIRAAAVRPKLFQSLKDHYEGRRPSEVSLRSYLIKSDYTIKAADKVVRVYLDTFDLASREGGEYNVALERDRDEPSDSPIMQPAAGQGRVQPTAPQVTVGVEEREFLHMPLSDDSAVRIIVKGPMTHKELKKLRQLIFIREVWDSLDKDEKNELKQDINQKLDEASEPE